MSPTLGAPWLAPLAPTLTLLGPLAMAGHWSVCLDRLNQMAHERGIVNARGHPLRFIDASLARPIPYESHVWLHGEVPTRTGEGAWHDFFNALMWITLPQTKAQLNALQAAAIEREGVGARRGPLRDAATLFDENAALVIAAPGPWLTAWRSRDWHSLFVTGRAAAGRQWLPVLFGHALLDKLRAPYKSVCAHGWLIHDPSLLPVHATDDELLAPAWLARLDAAAAGSLAQPGFRRDAFLPLPVLGWPGWCAANEDPRFYDDPAVFRPLPAASPS
ncbi:MAG TPA: DUF3025 domain-containing protein [Burkholderiaceae bacterium]|nr:DUF3025 domain-containing protein [Burkholderiaceae bacterium]